MNPRLWLLPEGIEELGPDQAKRVEELRRQLLDLFVSWGYSQVIPPLCEFLDALLTGTGSDLDLQTFKITDQASGRLMGIRPDMTPQVARMDARSHQPGAVQRFCYVGTVLRARVPHFQASRSPVQIGCELFGEADCSADSEIISLLLTALATCRVLPLHLDLAHMGLVHRLLHLSGLPPHLREELSDAWRRRAVPEVEEVAGKATDSQVAGWLRQLPRAIGDPAEVFAAVRDMRKDPQLAQALDSLESLCQILQQRFPEIKPCIDLCEMRGYNYHTGLVFAAYVPGSANAIAGGGRYDGIGGSFSRDDEPPRAATGFSIDLRAVLSATGSTAAGTVCRSAILVPADADASVWPLVQKLRAEGERVIQVMPSETRSWSEERWLVRKEKDGVSTWEVEAVQQL